MNALQLYLQQIQCDECWAMNLLQEHGIISDLCVYAEDVAPCDFEKAVAWLNARLTDEKL